MALQTIRKCHCRNHHCRLKHRGRHLTHYRATHTILHCAASIHPQVPSQVFTLPRIRKNASENISPSHTNSLLIKGVAYQIWELEAKQICSSITNIQQLDQSYTLYFDPSSKLRQHYANVQTYQALQKFSELILLNPSSVINSQKYYYCHQCRQFKCSRLFATCNYCSTIGAIEHSKASVNGIEYECSTIIT